MYLIEKILYDIFKWQSIILKNFFLQKENRVLSKENIETLMLQPVVLSSKLIKQIRFNTCQFGIQIISIKNKRLITEFTKALTQNYTIRKLDLGGQQIGDVGSIEIAKALSKHPSLEWLNFYDNDIGKGVDKIIEALEKNGNLRQFSLASNQIGDAEVSNITILLKPSYTLKWLNLSNNQIDMAGAIVIAEALKENSNLEGLELNKNKIRDDGVIAIAEALKENRTLKTLNIGLNGIGDLGATAINRLLMKNFVLQTVELRGNKIDDTILQQISMSLQRNKEISKENEEYAYYIAAALILRAAKIADELSFMVLEYCNGAATVEARKIVGNTLYPKAILFANQLEKSLTRGELLKVSQAILPLTCASPLTITPYNKMTTGKTAKSITDSASKPKNCYIL